MHTYPCFLITPTGQKTAEGFPIYRRTDTGHEMPYLNPGDRWPETIGAIYEVTWLDEYGHKAIEGAAAGHTSEERTQRVQEWKAANKPRHYQPDPTDGKLYACVTPGGTWIIDSRASNCTQPNDNTHNCWCRHGIAPKFTVDKNGHTCNAGAGSIQAGKWHGYLINGVLEER